MPSIIIATDFSDTAGKATNYACRLASGLDISLTVIHSFTLPVTFSDTPMPMIPVSEAQETAEKRMAEYMQQLREQYPTAQLESKVVYGDVVDVVNEFTSVAAPWLIIIGNTSSEDAWFDDTADTLRELKYPVLAVPPEVTYHPVKRICFAYDHTQEPGSVPIRQLIDICNTLNAELHVLNVSSGTTNANGASLHHSLTTVGAQYHFIDNEHVDESIHKFIESNDIDWLVVLPHKHSFFWGIFHKSHTATLARTAHIPIVALHDPQEQ